MYLQTFRSQDAKVLSDYVLEALENAPPDNNIDPACIYWGRFGYVITKGSTRHWGESHFERLSDMEDNDSDTRLNDYRELSATLEKATERMQSVVMFAFEADPSSRPHLCWAPTTTPTQRRSP